MDLSDVELPGSGVPGNIASPANPEGGGGGKAKKSAGKGGVPPTGATVDPSQLVKNMFAT
ncbi:MAG TPA: hypothetical protein VNO81_11080 [Candidatus Nitrosotenuis sp.]|nr:hypothetical protein [Candidatus Nitrosotenuis sp.]